MTAWIIEKEIGGCHYTDGRSVCCRDEGWMKLAQHGVRLRKFLMAKLKRIFMLLEKRVMVAFSVNCSC